MKGISSRASRVSPSLKVPIKIEVEENKSLPDQPAADAVKEEDKELLNKPSKKVSPMRISPMKDPVDQNEEE